MRTERCAIGQSWENRKQSPRFRLRKIPSLLLEHSRILLFSAHIEMCSCLITSLHCDIAPHGDTSELSSDESRPEIFLHRDCEQVALARNKRTSHWSQDILPLRDQSPFHPIGGGSTPICQSSAINSPRWWTSSSKTCMRTSSAVIKVTLWSSPVIRYFLLSSVDDNDRR